MKKKINGFTLIELLAVITLLSIILTITFSVVTNVLSDSRKNTYDSQISTIENAAKRYIADNIQALDEDGKNLISQEYDNLIGIGTLKMEGYLNSKEILKNPKTDRTMTGCVVATYAKTYNQFQYLYTDYGCLDTEANRTLTPEITMKLNSEGTYDVKITFPNEAENTNDTYVYIVGAESTTVTSGQEISETVSAGTKITAKVLRGDDVVRQITEIS